VTDGPVQPIAKSPSNDVIATKKATTTGFINHKAVLISIHLAKISCKTSSSLQKQCIQFSQQVRQQDAYPANAGRGQLQLCATPRRLFRGNISVADCMPPCSLLKTIKINSSVECRWCMTNSESELFNRVTLLRRQYYYDKN